MTITNDMPINLAKALNSESYSVPTHNIVGTTEVTSISLSATDLSGVTGTASSLTEARSLNEVTFEGIRLSTDVVSTSGDALKSAGITTASTGGTLQAGVVIDELHTTGFDLEFDWVLLIDRG